MSVSLAPLHFPPFSPLYRLTEAKGRELIGTASIGSEDNWNDSAWQTTHKGNGNAVQNYTQHYTYDEAGNILQLRHVAGIGSYTRDYTIDNASNRMEETQVGMDTYSYIYDTRGNMSEMPHLDNMKWNISNELYKTENGTMEAYYQYSGGQRIRKWVDKGSIKEERIYLGNFEIYRKFEGSSLKVERTTVHVSDDSGRIAMYEKRTYGLAADDNNTAATLIRYIYSNHLQSASLELDDNADIISYEEYHPYGTSSYQAMNASINAVAKRYRYTGKERDEESGLYYHGARYYIPWLGRWTAVDPLESKYAGMSPYNYAFNNPVVYNDPSGMEGEGGGWIRSPHREHVIYNSKVSTPEQAKSLYGSDVEYLGKSKAKYKSEVDNNYYTLFEKGEYTINDDPTRLSAYDDAQVHSPIEIASPNSTTSTGYEPISALGKKVLGAYSDVQRFFGDLTKPYLLGSEVSALAKTQGYSPYEATRQDLQLALDFVGSTEIPVVSWLADFSSGVISLYDGDKLGASLSFAGIFTPGLSQIKTGIKLTKAGKGVSNLWKVGAYKELQGLEAGLQAHHVGQKSLMGRLVSGYNPAKAPSILVPEIGHVANMPGVGRVAATRGLGGFTNARQVLARDILELRRVYGRQGIPNSSLQQLIQMNKTMYPGSFIK